MSAGNDVMVKTIGTQSKNPDWRVLKAVVAALWVTAGLTVLLVSYATRGDNDIVLTGNATASVSPAKAKAAPLHLVSSAAR